MLNTLKYKYRQKNLLQPSRFERILDALDKIQNIKLRNNLKLFLFFLRPRTYYEFYLYQVEDIKRKIVINDIKPIVSYLNQRVGFKFPDEFETYKLTIPRNIESIDDLK